MGIIAGELTPSKKTKNKKTVFGAASLVYSLNHPVLCARPWLPAWYVMSGGPHISPLL